MKSIQLLKSIILFLILSSLTACEEAEITILPLDTQLGNNTFGCYVDGKLFIRPYHNNTWGEAFYDRATKKVSVIAKSKDNRSISFIITDTQLYNNNIVDRATYSFLSDTVKTSEGIQYKTNNYSKINAEYVNLTKFDTINHILSGTFELTMVSDEDSTKTVTLTKGRFDSYLSFTTYPF